MKSSSPAPQDCAQAAPRLTALFDGEATATEAAQARAHLLSCHACSCLWLDWTQHRRTLQSEPVPAPPPTLLWRVLIAYRIAAFARPARRRSRLPDAASAAPLRGLEAPLPPRLTEHILARTTRQPDAHIAPASSAVASRAGVPLERARPQNVSPIVASRAGVPLTNPRCKTRERAFRRTPLLAAPALALWILLMGRADYSALIPRSAPAPLAIERPLTQTPAADASADNVLSANARTVVNSRARVTVARGAATREVPSAAVAPPPVSVAGAAPRAAASAGSVRGFNGRSDAPTARVLAISQAPRVRRSAGNRAAGEHLSRALLLAMSAGRRDVARSQTGAASDNLLGNGARAAQARTATESSPALSSDSVARRNARRAVSTSPEAAVSPREAAVGHAVALSVAYARPPVLTRARPASFSEDASAMPSRVAQSSAAGRRLARAMPSDVAASLRVSRPAGGAPTLREANYPIESGPRLEDVRSAVDDFRASIYDDRSSE